MAMEGAGWSRRGRKEMEVAGQEWGLQDGDGRCRMVCGSEVEGKWAKKDIYRLIQYTPYV